MKKLNQTIVPIPIVLLLIALVAALTMNFSSYVLGRSHGIREALEVFTPPTPQLDKNGCETMPTETEFGEIYLCNRQSLWCPFDKRETTESGMIVRCQ